MNIIFWSIAAATIASAALSTKRLNLWLDQAAALTILAAGVIVLTQATNAFTAAAYLAVIALGTVVSILTQVQSAEAWLMFNLMSFATSCALALVSLALPATSMHVLLSDWYGAVWIAPAALALFFSISGALENRQYRKTSQISSQA